MSRIRIKADVTVVLHERDRDKTTPEAEADRIGQKIHDALANETHAHIDVQVEGKDG